MSRVASGAWAGFVAGMVMALAMMGWMAARGESIWTQPNLIAAMWMGEGAAGGGFGPSALVGIATHQVTSVLMGVVAVPFVRDLDRTRTLLVSVAYAVASYPIVFGFILSWANPLMVRESSLAIMTLAHILFGAVFSTAYRWLRRR